MPNWFEENPTKSIIGYTLLIAGATWATSTFILQDNRLNLARSELESQKTSTEQYKAKVELLQRDIELLRSENAEYRNWLGQTKDAIPAIVPRITDLKEKVSKLDAELARARDNNPAPVNAPQEYTTHIGSAFIDEATGLVLTVMKANIDSTARVAIQFPGKDTPEEATINPGKQWKFRFKDKNYLLTVTDVSWLSDSIRFRISAEQ